MKGPVRVLAVALLACVTLQGAVRAQLAGQAGPALRRPSAAPAPTISLAADGYCVVTLRDQRTWQQGDPRIGAMFDGRQYLFATERQLAIFAAAPIVYAPVLSGDCLVTFAETGRRVAGQIQLGVVQGGRLYFFADAEARRKFLADPARYQSADVADGGRCLVTRVDQQREIDGLPETAVLCGGLRRLFAGAYQQSLYLQNSQQYDRASASPLPGAIASVGQVGRLPAEIGATVDVGSRANSPRKAAAADSTNDAAALDNDPMLGGYCPVTIRQRGVWVRGRYEDRVALPGLVFFTAGPEQRAALLENPDQYIPVLGGECAVSLLDFRQTVRGSIFHAAEYEGRLFLFSSAEHKAAFKLAPARYASADVAAHGECVVTLAETGRHLPGFPQYAAWHEGLLYRFVGEKEKTRFLAEPEKYAVAKAE